MSSKMCPLCGEKMKAGYLSSVASKGVYWLPEKNKLLGSFLSDFVVQKSGGFVLGKVTKIGFIASKKPKSYYCSLCKILTTYDIDY